MNLCKTCGKEIKSNKKYCSQECYRNRGEKPFSERTGVIKKCLSCGKDIYVKPSEIKTKNYCSVKCWTQSDRSKEIVSATKREEHKNNPKVGENNPSWRGGISEQTRKRTNKLSWRKLRKKILARDYYICSRCGVSEKVMHVHHIIPVCFGGTDDIKNLITLCPKCHPYVENRTINKIYKTAIKKKCKKCKGSINEIRYCSSLDCPLYEVRPYQEKKNDL